MNWPVGLGGKGNEGVTQQVKQLEGTIGYVELIYAVSNKLPYANVKNAAGNFVAPNLESVTAAAASAKFAPDTDFRVSITNAPGADAYPIASFTWLLVRPDIEGRGQGEADRDFLAWMVTPEAQAMAAELQLRAAARAEVIALIRAADRRAQGERQAHSRQLVPSLVSARRPASLGSGPPCFTPHLRDTSVTFA